MIKSFYLLVENNNNLTKKLMIGVLGGTLTAKGVHNLLNPSESDIENNEKEYDEKKYNQKKEFANLTGSLAGVASGIGLGLLADKYYKNKDKQNENKNN
jgi:hypothetical protein